jgi:hypothetical protein
MQPTITADDIKKLHGYILELYYSIEELEEKENNQAVEQALFHLKFSVECLIFNELKKIKEHANPSIKL